MAQTAEGDLHCSRRSCILLGGAFPYPPLALTGLGFGLPPLLFDPRLARGNRLAAAGWLRGGVRRVLWRRPADVQGNFAVPAGGRWRVAKR